MLLRNVAPLWPFNGFTSFEDVGKRQGKTWEYFVPEVLGFAYLLYTAPCMHLDHAQGWTQPTPHEIQPQGTDGFSRYVVSAISGRDDLNRERRSTISRRTILIKRICDSGFHKGNVGFRTVLSLNRKSISSTTRPNSRASMNSLNPVAIG